MLTSDDFWMPVQTRRGCPMNCSYCSTAAIEGCILRKRSVELVVEWMLGWTKLGVRKFYFVDNTFNLPPSYAKSLCRMITDNECNTEWRCIFYPVNVDEELIRLMASAGCEEVSLGFESGSELILHGMNKKFRPEDVRKSSDLMAKFGIRRMGFLLLGGPGETRESVMESLRFADSLNLEMVKVTAGIRIYPQTALARAAVEDGIVSEDDDLLKPRFYMACGLGDWLNQTVAEWISSRPNWMS